MADFVAVLRKTIDGLGTTTPALRARVYDKARGAIHAKLKATNPPLSAEAIERQKRALETAIETVEFDYAVDDAAGITPGMLKTAAPVAPAQPHGASPFRTLPVRPQSPFARPGSVIQPEPPIVRPEPVARQETAAKPAPVSQPRTASPDPVLSHDMRPLPGGPRGRGLAAAITFGLVAVAAGGGYFAWQNREAISIALGMDKKVASETPEQPAGAKPASDVPVKLTQRLNEDGTETDPGPAGGVPAIGEGTTVAAATQPSQPPAAEEPAAPAAEPADAAAVPLPAAPAEPAAPAQPAAPAPQTPAIVAEAPAPAAESVSVGQKAIFYEERTGAAEGSANAGAVVWSVVQESPGDGLPAEPVIRAEATIAERDLKMRLTIRRNADKTLPASHIFEILFLTDEKFTSGPIDTVLRVTFKDREESAGNPLLGVPAKIADGFFLVALTEGAAEVETNTTLMRRDQWIDIPIVYSSGRRALVTIEKGIPGDKAFDEALKAWGAKASG